MELADRVAKAAPAGAKAAPEALQAVEPAGVGLDSTGVEPFNQVTSTN